MKDHPRSRGEYKRCHRNRVYQNGSSPLSRGIPVNRGKEVVEDRIIPALAGNTGSFAIS